MIATAKARMEFALLGPFEVTIGGRALRIGSRQQRTILAVLTLHLNRPVPVAVLVEELWGEIAPASANTTAQGVVWRLRRALAAGEVEIRATGSGYVMKADPEQVDAYRFEHLAARGRELVDQGKLEEAVVSFRAALALWRGPALADFADQDFAVGEATRLDEARLAVTEELAGAELATGRLAEALARLERHVAAHPLRERAWGQLMVALYRLGRQAEALRAYQRVRKLLGDELGLEPTPPLRLLEEQILLQSPELESAASWLGDRATTALRRNAPAVALPPLLTPPGRIFVGRTEELERCSALWRQAVGGERRVALLAGEPGIGKTRLAAQLAEALHRQGAVVLAGRCDEDLSVPYQPFVEALRYYLAHVPSPRLGRHPGELTRLVPELAESVPGVPQPLRSDPETERYRLFDALAAWLGDVSQERPVLLVLDDLQWATKPTVLLLRHVLRCPEALRLLVVVTYRDTDVGRTHPLMDFLADVRKEQGYERLGLGGLDREAVERFLEAAAGHELTDEGEELARVVWSETNGHPFFIAEVLRHLVESGVLERQEGRWVTTPQLHELGITEGVRDVVGRRLGRLAPATDRALQVASVVGLEFESAVVRVAGSFEDEQLLASLEEATRARLLTEVSDAGYRFSHALVRSTLYDELSRHRRIALHRKVAEAIEALHAEALDDHLPALAHHYAQASGPREAEKAATFARRAGDRALSQLANEEAVSFYRQALELLEGGGSPVESSQRLEILITLGEAQRRAGQPDHRQTLLEAARLASERHDADALARAALANGRLGLGPVASVDLERVATLEVALEAFEERRGSIRARLLAALALELTYAGDRQRCRRLSDEALAEARRSDDPATLAHVLAARPVAIHAPGTLAERGDNVGELLATAERLGDPAILAWGHIHRYRVSMQLGRVEEAAVDVESLERLAGELNQPLFLWYRALLRTSHLAFLGRLEEAEEQLRGVAELGEVTGQPDGSVVVLTLQTGVRFQQGRLGESRQLLSETVARYPAILYRAMVPLLEIEVGRPEVAAELFEALAASDFVDVPSDALWSATMGCLSTVAARLGDRRRSLLLHRLLAPWVDETAGTSFLWLGSVSYYLGLLASTLGLYEEAEADFAAAEAAHLRMGAPCWLARTRLEWARTLVARRQPGDVQRARRLLDPVLAIARELGLVSLERSATALLERIAAASAH